MLSTLLWLQDVVVFSYGSCKYNSETIAIKSPYNFIKSMKVKCIFLPQHHNILGIREMFKNTVTLRVMDNNASLNLIVIMSVRN
jgi:hypothetical protein